MSQAFPQMSKSGNAATSSVKQLRAAFESQLITDGGSAIETWLNRVPTAERASLFVELLDAELSFHHRRGHEVRPETYLARFPDWKMEIDSVFHSQAEKSLQGSDDRSLESTVDVVPSKKSLTEELKKEWRDWTAGDFVGRYRLDEILGHGAFGEVWKGFDPELRRPVAIKLPRKDLFDREDLTRQFRDEARRAASLKHEAIVPVYDIGQANARTFIVSEFVDGPTLAERMKAGPITRDEAVRIVAQLARTLHQAHRAGLVHRDIKPSNVLLREDGSPAITDFGLAISEFEQLNASAGVVGTVAYMSPEQARGEGHRVDGRSDLYSLGVILFQMLTGRHPFQFQNSRDLLDQIIHREARPARSIDDTISLELDRICSRCLSKDVAQRYPTGLDLADDLQQVSNVPKKRSRPLVVGLVVVSAVVLVSLTLSAVIPKAKVGAEPNAVMRQRIDEPMELLDQPLERVAYVKADPTDDAELDRDKRVLRLRSDRNWMILGTPYKGASPFRMAGSIHLNDWVGNVGFVWGLSEDLTALPKKQQKSMALIIHRTGPNESARLILQQMIVGEMLFDVQWVNNVTVIDDQLIEVKDNEFHNLELAVDETGIEVFWDGKPIWKPSLNDPNRLNLVTAEGHLGFVGQGKSVVFRDTTVKFSAPAKRNNE